MRLRDKSVILHEAYFTDKLMIDQDILGQSVSPPTVGAVSSSTAPLAKFFDGFAVPGNFSAGQLKVQINVKLGGNLDCYGDTRVLPVKPAPVTNMTRLPHDKPVWSDPNVGTLRWHWGNGVGSTGFNAHSYPEHRYSYNVNVWDSQNKSLKAGGDPLKNEDYYCWNQPIRAMDPGKIHFVDDSNPDNQGNAGDVDNNPANLVIIYNQEKDVFQLYAHVRQHSAIDKNGNKLVVGAPVQAGDLIGRCGNAGGTSEPHLHVGISRRDSEGFLRSLPMTLSKIKNGSGQAVSGVPADNDFYSS